MRSRVAGLLGAGLLVPVLAAAQVPLQQEQSTRLRDRYRTPQNSAKLDDSVRKLRSDDTEDRLEGIRGLGEVNDAKATEYLIGAASDPDPRVRIKAIDTLGHIKAKDATTLLVQQLFMRDTDLGTKRHILASLGKIGDPHATAPIRDFLARDVEHAARGNAIFALGEIGDPAALPTLEAIARDSSDEILRGLAQGAVRKIRERPAPPVAVPALAGERRLEGPAPTP